MATTSENPDRQDTIAGRSSVWAYIGPITVASLMLLGVGILAWHAEFSGGAFRHMKMRMGRHAARNANMLAASIRFRSRFETISRDDFNAFLSELVEESRLRFVSVERESVRLFEAGDVPAFDRPNAAEGSLIGDDFFVYWRPLSLPKSVARSTLPPLFGQDGDVTLVVGVPRMKFHRRGPPFLVRHVVPLTLILMLIVLASLVWALIIRSRMLRVRLEVEKARAAHLEDMGLAAAGLAHETKNPLGIIRGFAQRIGDDASVNEETRSMAERIIEATDRATARLGAFMAYAKPPQAEIQAIDGMKALGRVVEVLRPDFESSEVKVEVGGDELTIKADEDMLQQIVVNLLLNSLHASEKGQTVAVRLERREKSAALVVQDQGSGIPAELISRVFKPYVSGRPEGHGLGLAVVKQLANHHGWSVEIDSRSSEGTRVVIANIEVLQPGREAS